MRVEEEHSLYKLSYAIMMISMKNIKKVSQRSYLRDMIEVIAAFFLAWLFYQGLAIAAGTPMPIVSVVSDSMEPVLHRGDLLLVTGDENYEIDDIIIFNKPGIPYTVVHRIVAKTDKGFITKGDNNPVADPGYIMLDEIKGKVRFAIPVLGYPRLALMIFGI